MDAVDKRMDIFYQIKIPENPFSHLYFPENPEALCRESERHGPSSLVIFPSVTASAAAAVFVIAAKAPPPPSWLNS